MLSVHSRTAPPQTLLARYAAVLAAAACLGWASTVKDMSTALETLVGTSLIAVALAAARASRQEDTTRLWIATSAAAFVLVLTARLAVGREAKVLCVLILLLGIAPFAAWLRGVGPRIPFFPSICLLYAVLYGTGPLVAKAFVAGSQPVPLSAVRPALFCAFIGLLLMEVTYFWLVRHPTSVSKLQDLRLSAYTDNTWIGLAFGGIALYAVLPRVVPLGIQQLAHFAAEIPTIAIAELAIRWRVGALSRRGRAFLLFAIPIRLFIGLATAYNAQAYFVILALGLAVISVRRRFPVVLVILAVVSLGVLQPVKDAYRQTVRSSGDSYTSPYAQAGAYSHIAIESANGTLPLGDVREAFAARFGYSSTLGYVMEQTPDAVDYWRGATYYPLFSKLLPRFIFHSKPQEVTGQTFGHRYGLLLPHDFVTSYNMPQFVELFANFGWVGVLLGMPLFAILYFACERILTLRAQNLIGTSGVAYLLSSMVVIESGLSLRFSGFIYSVGLLCGLHLVLRRLTGRVDAQTREVSAPAS